MSAPPAVVNAEEFEVYRRELTGYCYRMLGSGSEAEDAVQDTFVRAWRAAEKFEGRSSLRSWLYRIATNTCIDMMRGPQRRARPMDLGPSSAPDVANLDAGRPENTWITPIADERVLPESGDPADVAAARDSVRLAFVAALQHLPARQRAVLILCEVLRWKAAEVAELLDTSVASVNSALQRARDTLASLPAEPDAVDVSREHRDVVDRFVAAFQRYDVPAIVSLLADDAVQSMPPYAMWMQGASNIAVWLEGPGEGCRGSHLVPLWANGCPAFGQYRVDPDGGHTPWAIQVLEIADGRITGYHNFLGAELFAEFGLPAHLPPS